MPIPKSEYIWFDGQLIQEEFFAIVNGKKADRFNWLTFVDEEMQ